MWTLRTSPTTVACQKHRLSLRFTLDDADIGNVPIGPLRPGRLYLGLVSSKRKSVRCSIGYKIAGRQCDRLCRRHLYLEFGGDTNTGVLGRTGRKIVRTT